MITSLIREPPGSTLRVDIAIVGAGAAGITLALELAGSGAKVALFEGGAQQLDDTSQSRYEGEVTVGDGMEYPPLDAWRLRYFGGTTNHWGGWCRPLEPNVFRARPGVVDVGWPFDRAELDGPYERAHELCQLGRPVYDSSALCAAAGVPEPFRSTDTLATTAWRYSPPTRFGEAYAAQLEQSDVSVYLDANCTSLDIAGGRVTGLQLVGPDARSRSVVAPRVILACGAIENVRHLLLAQRAGADALGRSGMLGLGFMEHLHVDAGYVLADAADVAPGGRLAAALGLPADEDGTLFKVALSLTETALDAWGLANVSFTMMEAFDQAVSLPFGESQRALWGAAHSTTPTLVNLYARTEQRVNEESRIELIDQRDDLGMPRVRLDWRLRPEDVRDVETARRLVCGELMAQGFGPAVLGPTAALPHVVTGGGHHIGGARMHEDPDRGVVDGDQQVHGIDGLHVTGSSAFPSECYSNPTLTIVALAVRLARRLGAEG